MKVVMVVQIVEAKGVLSDADVLRIGGAYSPASIIAETIAADDTLASFDKIQTLIFRFLPRGLIVKLSKFMLQTP